MILVLAGLYFCSIFGNPGIGSDFGSGVLYFY